MRVTTMTIVHGIELSFSPPTIGNKDQTQRTQTIRHLGARGHDRRTSPHRKLSICNTRVQCPAGTEGSNATKRSEALLFERSSYVTRVTKIVDSGRPAK